MKKNINIFLVISLLALSINIVSAKEINFKNLFKKNVTVEENEQIQEDDFYDVLDEIDDESQQNESNLADVKEDKDKKFNLFKKKEKKIVIVEEKEKKINSKKEKKKEKARKEAQTKASSEAQGMYETKFPTIQSSIEYNETLVNSADLKDLKLSDCIKLAFENNPAIMSALANSEAYKARINQIWANYFPTLGAGVSYSRIDALSTVKSGLGGASMNRRYDMYYTPTLSANMLLFDFGKTKAMADMAKRDWEQSRYDAEMSIENVIYNVKTAYYNVLFAKAQKVVYEDTVKDYELQLKQAKAFFDIGKKAKIDVTTAEYNLGNANVNLIKAKNTLELAYVQLANAIGIPEFDNMNLVDKLNTKEYVVDFNNLIDVANKSRPSLLSAKKKMDSAELNIRSAKRELTPDLSAYGGYDRGGAKMDMDYGYQFGVQFNYTALNLLAVKKQIDEAKALYKKYSADYELQKQNVYLEVKSAFISLLNSHDSFVVAKLALQQAKEQQYQAYRRYQVGLGNAIEFKDAENTYLNAKLNYYSNLLEYNINAAELERVVGSPIKESDVDL